MRKDNRGRVYKSTLIREYGLTPSMIEELGPPDEFVDNPHYRNGPLASLYSVERVENWIAYNTERLEKAQADRAKRSAAAKERADAKRAEKLQQGMDWVMNVPITVAAVPETVIDDAKRRFRFRKGVDDPLAQKALHAYVRHELSNYDMLRQEIRERPFPEQLHGALRERVDTVVKDALVEWKHASHGNQPSSAAAK